MADSEVRQKFEELMNRRHSNTRRFGEAYVDMLTQRDWEVYEAGMRAGEIAQWIPVEEKLPPKNTKVLVWFRENTTTGPIYIPRFGEISCGHWRPEGGNGNFDDRVTHWQPLPAAPEEKK